MSHSNDTIAAIATAPGRGGIGIVRLSGPDSSRIASRVCGSLPQPRKAGFRYFRDDKGDEIDHGLVLHFPAPFSFTGEDVIELHGHGGTVVLDMLMQRMLALGARQARPGEFSERAFLNDKLDLVQAEAIADLIDSGSQQAARAALRSLRGVFSKRINALTDSVTTLRMHVEAAIDFPEEEVDFLSDEKLKTRFTQLLAEHNDLLKSAAEGSLLREGMTVVLTGLPNAGKSSLLNVLAGHDAAIVTDIPGTTRDVLREHLAVDGLPVHVIDTAGIQDSSNPVEQEGIKRAWREIEAADSVIQVIDDTQGVSAADDEALAKLPHGLGVIRVMNKIDISGREAGVVEDGKIPTVGLSARTGQGLDELRRQLKKAAGYHLTGENNVSARRRHVEAIKRAGTHLVNAQQHFQQRTGELAAEELRLAQRELGEITGQISSDELLGMIFSSFCIGK